VVQSSQGGGHGISEEDGPRRLPPYPSLISILELAIWLVGKAHVTKMKLNLNVFLIWASNYYIFKNPLISTNLTTCSAKLTLPAAERSQ